MHLCLAFDTIGNIHSLPNKAWLLFTNTCVGGIGVDSAVGAKFDRGLCGKDFFLAPSILQDMISQYKIQDIVRLMRVG
jgi:hypothetical protein